MLLWIWTAHISYIQYSTVNIFTLYVIIDCESTLDCWQYYWVEWQQLTIHRSYIYGHIHNMCHRDICIYVQGAGMENNNNCYIEGTTLKFVFRTWWITLFQQDKKNLLMYSVQKITKPLNRKFWLKWSINSFAKVFLRSVLPTCTWQLWLMYFTTVSCT
jgi:hypothetical protein